MKTIMTTGASVFAGASALTAFSRTRSLLLHNSGAYDEANSLWHFSQRMARFAAAAGLVAVAATVGGRARVS